MVWYRRAHYRIHKSLPPVPQPSQSNPVHKTSPPPANSLLKIQFNIIAPSTPRSCKWSLSFRLPHKTRHASVLSPTRATCPAHLILPSSTEYSARSASHEAPHYVVFSTPLLPRPSQTQISPSTPYSPTPSAYVSPSVCETKFHTHKTKQDKLQFCTF